ncbi:MAG: DNA-processing protein DprA [Nitrospirales bacterium]
MEDLPAWLALHSVKGLGAGTISRLVRHFGSPQAVQTASASDLSRHAGISAALANRIRQSPDEQTVASIQHEVKAVEQGSFAVLSILDTEYPARLQTIPDPPPLLYVTGKLDASDQQAIAIVGSRKATPTGCAFTYKLSRELSTIGFTIVSGLARGIDKSAHEGALEGMGRTIAVLGCGIDQTYPREHQALRSRIEEQGAVLTEFPPKAAPHAYHFPQRNRLISGMSLGVVVTEAAENSGSLITAKLALDQNREVFAVPGAVTNKMSRGPHLLIKQGAKLVEGIDDILEELIPQIENAMSEQWKDRCQATSSSSLELGVAEEALYNQISLEPITLEELLSQGTSTPSEVMSLLLSLEMKGVIQQLAGSQYIRSAIR